MYQLLDTVTPETFFLAANIRREASDKKENSPWLKFLGVELSRQARVTGNSGVGDHTRHTAGPGRHTDGLKLDGRGGQQGLLAMQLANQGGSLDQLARYRPAIYITCKFDVDIVLTR